MYGSFGGLKDNSGPTEEVVLLMVLECKFSNKSIINLTIYKWDR